MTKIRLTGVINQKQMIRMMNSAQRKALFETPKEVVLDISIGRGVDWEFIFSINYSVYKGTEVIVRNGNGYHIKSSENLVKMVINMVTNGVLPNRVVLDNSDKGYMSKKIFLDMFPKHLEESGEYLYLLDDEETWVAYEPIDSSKGNINGYIAKKPVLTKVQDVVSYKVIKRYPDPKLYSLKDNGKLEFAKRYLEGYSHLEWIDVTYPQYLEAKEVLNYMNSIDKYPELLMDMITCHKIEDWQKCIEYMNKVFNKYLIDRIRGILNTKYMTGEDTYFRNEDIVSFNCDEFSTKDGEDE
jgi:hypothetical protein